MMHSESSKPLVSVIIPCYNQARYLSDAIQSVLRQSYAHTEIVVVDDGSSDTTRETALSFAKVKYVFQSHAGLSAARNTGVAHATGVFIVFLDADDILYPDALETNTRVLLQHPAWAFVSGTHDKLNEWLYPITREEETCEVPGSPYLALLRGNYIGMHAAVMYRCRVFDSFLFDTSLDACEDYDLYLRVARKYPVGSHLQKIAGYRQHGANMSSDYMKMLKRVLEVHSRQRALLKTPEEERAWAEGRKIWAEYYGIIAYRKHYNSVYKDVSWPAFKEMKLMASATGGKFWKYVVKKMRHQCGVFLKEVLPDGVVRKLYSAGIYKAYTPPPGKIRSGDFDRVTPFSTQFGFDRGGAIDRFYIERFLEEHREHIRGRVLEIGDNAYTMRFGGQRVLKSDVLHVDHNNKQATYIGDITDIPEMPSQAFDCIIFTQTLHLIYDFKSALNTCYRILKPGGSLLLTVPGISHIDHGMWRDYWLWSFTDKAVTRMMADTFNGSRVEVKSYGNVYVAAAFLYGMGLPEFRKEFLYHNDASYQVIVSASAIKH